MKVRDLLVVLCLIAASLAVIHLHSREKNGKSDERRPDESGPPRLKLEIVSDPGRLEDLVLRGKLTSGRPIAINLPDGIPDTTLWMSANGSEYRFTSEDYSRDTNPDDGLVLFELSVASNLEEVTEREWEIRPGRLHCQQRDQIEQALQHDPVAISISVAYQSSGETRFQQVKATTVHQPPFPSPPSAKTLPKGDQSTLFRVRKVTGQGQFSDENTATAGFVPHRPEQNASTPPILTPNTPAPAPPPATSR